MHRPLIHAILTKNGAAFDERYLHIELADERVLSIPLHWIPPLRDASPADRAKYHLSEARDALIWDPEEGEVNEILRLTDYLSVRCPIG